ncbi:MAG: hypothetical protein ACLGSH_06075 [Acidobacteriota bacterium]
MTNAVREAAKRQEQKRIERIAKKHRAAFEELGPEDVHLNLDRKESPVVDAAYRAFAAMAKKKVN